MEHDNLQVRTHINGTLYSVLTRVSLKDEANQLGLGELLEYMINNHKTIFEEKLWEKQLTPKIMNEFDVTALLQVSGITIWQ